MTDYLKDPDFMNPACVAVWEELLDELERSDVSPAEAGARDAALEEVPLKTSDHPADARESSSGT